MKKFNIALVFLLLIFNFSFTSALFEYTTQTNANTLKGLQVYYPELTVVKQNTTFNLYVHVSNLSNGYPMSNSGIDCKIHLYDDIGNHTLESGIMTKDTNGYDHTIYLSEGNFTKLGEHAFYIWCNNSDLGGEAKGSFEVTPSGEILEIPKTLMGITLLLFFMSLFVGLHYLSKTTNYEQWNNKIIKRYKNKNYIKLALSSIAYNLMKNIYVIYYLNGFVIMIIVTAIAYTFNIVQLLEILKAMMYVYATMSVLIAILLFSNVQEWLYTLLEEVKNMKWGV